MNLDTGGFVTYKNTSSKCELCDIGILKDNLFMLQLGFSYDFSIWLKQHEELINY